MNDDEILNAHASEEVATGEHRWEHVGTGAEMFGDWLTVKEAVAYCHEKGLNRTAKTVRKWAQLAHQSGGEGEIVVRRQDTENGFRWSIERRSLDVKIAQEKEFDVRKGDGEMGEQVHTGVHPLLPVHTSADAEGSDIPDANASEPVATGAHASARAERNDEMIDFLKQQITEKDRQLRTKDEQIGQMLERDRETNFLIRGLQDMLPLAAPRERRSDGEGDNSTVHSI